MHDAVNGAGRTIRDVRVGPHRRARPSGSRCRWCGPSRALGSVPGAPVLVGCGARGVRVRRSPDGRSKAVGMKLGAAVGQVIRNVHAEDGWNSVDPFDPEPTPGIWRPTPPAFLPMSEPQFQNVAPFTIESRAQFSIAPPPALTARDYQRVFNEVKSIGQDSSATRTANQTHIAHFWFEPPYRLLEPDSGHPAIGQRIRAPPDRPALRPGEHGRRRRPCCRWYWKRQYGFWRPITAIREADLDGNPATSADGAWQPLRATPSHPDHPSTHSVTGGAAAEVIRRFVGSDRHRFCMTTLTAIPSGSTRCYETFSEAQDENTNSRVYAGIHFRTAIQAGDRLGRRDRALRVPTRASPSAALPSTRRRPRGVRRTGNSKC